MKKLVWMFLASLLAFSSCVKDEIVTPEVDKSAEKKIVSFKFSELSPEVIAVVSEDLKTITAEVPSSTDVTALKPTISVSDKATVNPVSNEPVNFTEEVDYTVTAEDGSTVIYSVTVTKAQPLLTVDPISESTVKERGGMFIITGANFTEGDMKVYLFNSSTEYEMQIVTETSTSITFLIIHEMELGNYNLKLTDGIQEVVADKEFTIEIESPSVSSINKTEVIQGGGLIISGKYFGTTNADNQVFLGENEITVVSSSASELEVTVPESIPVGEYTIKVVSNGKTTYYNTQKLNVIANPTKPIITNISAYSYSRGETIVITGENLKKAGVATNINFMPFPSGTTIVRSGVANAEGTEVTYTIPNDFPTGNYVIVVEVDFEYSNEYDEVIQINP